MLGCWSREPGEVDVTVLQPRKYGEGAPTSATGCMSARAQTAQQQHLAGPLRTILLLCV